MLFIKRIYSEKIAETKDGSIFGDPIYLNEYNQRVFPQDGVTYNVMGMIGKYSEEKGTFIFLKKDEA